MVRKGPVAPHGPAAEVTEVGLFGFLLLMHPGQFFLRAEARVRMALLYKLFGVDMVDRSALALAVRAVCPALSVNRGAFVKFNMVMAQSPN